MNEMLFRGLLSTVTSLSVLGQVSGNRYEALKQALGLRDSQVWQLQQVSRAAITINRPTPAAARRAINRTNVLTQNGYSLRDPILDDSQQTKLAVIEKVLDRSDTASLAITLGLISAQRWPGRSLCYYPIRAYASELGLSESQVWQLERLQQAAREPLYAQITEKENRRLEFLNSGGSADSPTVVQLISEISKLQKQAAETRPERDLALAVLDDTQKAKLAAFETALQLAREAIELGLTPDPPKGEVLCH
jgi:hypothetical protein